MWYNLRANLSKMIEYLSQPTPYITLPTCPGSTNHLDKLALLRVTKNRGITFYGALTMKKQPKPLNFRPIPGKKGYYVTGGMVAELLWNPYEELKRSQQKEREQAGKPRPKRAYEILQERMPDAVEREVRIIGLTCEWCNGQLSPGDDDTVCTRCRYRACASCGTIYRATSDHSRTCSSYCAETLNSGRGRWEILERDNFCCVYCGLSAPDDNAMLHVDHIVPVSSGGKSYAKNLITSCKPCNLEKSKRRMSPENEQKIIALAAERNHSRGIEQNRVMRLREND